MSRLLFILRQAAIDRSTARRGGGQRDFRDGERSWREIGHGAQNYITVHGRALDRANGLIGIRTHGMTTRGGEVDGR